MHQIGGPFGDGRRGARSLSSRFSDSWRCVCWKEGPHCTVHLKMAPIDVAKLVFSRE